MEQCIITKKWLPDEQVVYTLDGVPVAVFLWGRNPIKMKDNLALIPTNLAERYKKALGKEADPETFEK